VYDAEGAGGVFEGVAGVRWGERRCAEMQSEDRSGFVVACVLLVDTLGMVETVTQNSLGSFRIADSGSRLTGL